MNGYGIADNLVISFLRLDNCRTFKGAVISAVFGQIGDQQILLPGLPQQHAEDLDLLAASEDEVQRYSGHTSHLNVVHHNGQTIHQLLR